MTVISISDAQVKLAELIDGLEVSGNVVITKDNQPIAQLTSLAAPFGEPVPGRCMGVLTVVGEDDDHLADWSEYMP